MVALGQGCSVPTAHWALWDKNLLGRDCFQQAEPAPVAALLSITQKSAPGNIARMMTLGPRDDIRIQGCLNNLLSAVTSCSKTVPTFRSLCFHQAGPCPMNMPGLDGSSASASPSQRDSGCCHLPSSCHVPAILRNSFELMDFEWELNDLLGCILLRGKWLCHLCPAFLGDVINYAQTHRQDSSTGHTA